MKKFLFSIQIQPNRCPLPCEPASAMVAVVGDLTLYDLAEGLVSAVGFNFDHPFGFYSNLRTPYGKSDEKYTLFADVGESEDGEPGVQKTLIADVFTPGKKMLFLFDYGDDWHFHVKCLEAEELDGSAETEVWLVGDPKGSFPEQYPQFE